VQVNPHSLPQILSFSLFMNRYVSGCRHFPVEIASACQKYRPKAAKELEQNPSRPADFAFSCSSSSFWTANF
jgi:hypothetical protein